MRCHALLQGIFLTHESNLHLLCLLHWQVDSLNEGHLGKSESESHSIVSDSLWPHGLQPSRLLCPWGFSRQEYWSALPCPPPGDVPNPGIKPRSPALQAHSSEPPGKPKNTGVGSLSLLQGNCLTQESNGGLLHCRQILYQLSYHLARKQNKIMPSAATWMGLEITIPSEVSQKEKDTHRKILLICGI